MGSLSRFNLNRIIGGYNTINMFETGTFWGDGVACALESPFANIVSVEIIPEIAEKARIRFSQESKVEILEMDSLAALKYRLPSLKGNTLFWLDAHYPGADAGMAAYDSVRDEDLRLPLQKELEVICKYRAGCNDVFILDDLRTYEDGPFENGNAAVEILPRHNRNIDFIYKYFSKTHLIIKLYQDEGYVILLPTKNFNRNHASVRDLMAREPFSKKYYLENRSKDAAWNSGDKLGTSKRRSELCKAKDSKTVWYQRWCSDVQESLKLHRKQWEYAYILQALWERGCMAVGKKGLGFQVASEPLPALFAHYGCSITATDTKAAGSKEETAGENQEFFEASLLNKNGICEENKFNMLVNYRQVDMNNIPGDLADFDFTWSSGSFHQLGGIEKGLEFLQNQLATLKPGGWAVHTTEYNISSNDETVENGNTVVYRQRDIDRIVADLRNAGHTVEELDYSLGGLEEDFIIDLPPYQQEPHLKLQIDKYVVTSIGLIIQKKL